MPQNPARTARTRAEILDHAGRLFRLRGYAGTNIDDVMLAAGLTRGAFYAHFNVEGRSVHRGGHRRHRPAHAAARRGARRGAESLSRQGRAGRERAHLRARRPALRRRPRAAAGAARLRQPAPRCDRRDRAARRSASSTRDATVAAILAVGAVAPRARLGRHAAQRLAAALRARGPCGRCSSRELRQRRNDRRHAGKPLALVVPGALHDHAVVGPQRPKARSSAARR